MSVKFNVNDPMFGQLTSKVDPEKIPAVETKATEIKKDSYVLNNILNKYGIADPKTYRPQMMTGTIGNPYTLAVLAVAAIVEACGSSVLAPSDEDATDGAADTGADTQLDIPELPPTDTAEPTPEEIAAEASEPVAEETVAEEIAEEVFEAAPEETTTETIAEETALETVEETAAEALPEETTAEQVAEQLPELNEVVEPTEVIEPTEIVEATETDEVIPTETTEEETVAPIFDNVLCTNVFENTCFSSSEISFTFKEKVTQCMSAQFYLDGIELPLGTEGKLDSGLLGALSTPLSNVTAKFSGDNVQPKINGEEIMYLPAYDSGNLVDESWQGILDGAVVSVLNVDATPGYESIKVYFYPEYNLGVTCVSQYNYPCGTDDVQCY